MTNMILVILVFCIGFGWGSATMAVLFAHKAKLILEHSQRTLDLMEETLEQGGKTRQYVKECAGTSLDIFYETAEIAKLTQDVFNQNKELVSKIYGEQNEV